MKKLERTIGLPTVIAICVSTMLGSGIFVLPGFAAALTGPSVWLAYLAAGLCVLPATLSQAELATAMPASGGAYTYLDRTYGPLVGTMAGVGLWLSLLMKSAFALVGFGAYLLVLADVPLKGASFALLGLVTALNLVGVKAVGRVQVAVVATAVVTVSLLALDGVTRFEPSRLDPLFPFGAKGFIAAVGFVFVSYAGINKVAAVAEEVRDPGRNLPLGMLISLGAVCAFYAAVVLVLVGDMPPDVLHKDYHPIYSLAHEVAPLTETFFALLGVATMTSMANAGLLAASRFPFAMGRDRLLPNALRSIHPTLKTPIPSILLTSAVMAAALALLDIPKLAKLASAFTLILFVLVNSAVIVMRESGARWYRPPFRAPLYPLTQIFGMLACLVLLVVLGPAALAAGLGAALPGLVLYYSYGRPRALRSGIFSRVIRRERPGSSAPVGTDPIPEVPEMDASALILMFGDERAPHTLMDVGAALAGSRRIEVVRLAELPEQTALFAGIHEEAAVLALRRECAKRGVEEGLDLEFEAVVTHDVPRSVLGLSNRTHCEWAVMEWGEPGRRGFLSHRQRRWLLDHMHCHLALYRCLGSEGPVRRILVYAEPGLNDGFVVRTADHLAGLHGAALTFLGYLPRGEDDGPLLEYLHGLRGRCRAPGRTLVVRGDRLTTSLVRATAAFDLLVMEAPPPDRPPTLFREDPGDEITRRSACSVLRLRVHAPLPRLVVPHGEPRGPSTGPGASGARTRPGAESSEPAGVDGR